MAVEQVKFDLSSFMAVLIMTIGCMIILLVTNVVVIISNPENLTITTLVPRAYEPDSDEDKELAKKMGEPMFSNKDKEPSYVDVNPDKLIIYPGEHVLPIQDLEQSGNAFEQLLNQVAEHRDTEYIILVLRPESSRIAKVLRSAIVDRNIDVGMELFDKDKEINYIKAN